MGIAADFVLILLAGLAGGVLARALGLPLLIGYVAAGVAVGPYTAGPTVVQLEDIERLAEIGAALLLFALGLEMSFRDLQPVRKIALIGGPLQILLITVIGALAAPRFLGMGSTEAVWFGAMISLSSSVVVLKTLSAAGVLSTLASRVMIGLLVVQDLAVVPMLIILPQFGDLEGLPLRLATAMGAATAFLAVVVFLGTRLLPRILQRVLEWGSRELFLISVVAIGTGLGYATHLVGLSFALGAFVAGLILSESEFSHQALSDIIPLRDVFGLLFFVTVGMLLDVRFALDNWMAIVATVALIFLGKAVILGGMSRLFGYANMAPWIIGLGLAQIGEFSFVLARAGVSSGALSRATYDFVLSCTVLTMAFAPAVSSLALPLARGWQRWRKPAPMAEPLDLPRHNLEDHVIVAGAGRSGAAVAGVLKTAGIPLLIVEPNVPVFHDVRAAGIAAILGDIASEEILSVAGARRARMLVLTTPDLSTAHLATERAKHLNPRLVVIARAARASHVPELRRLGVDAIVQAEFEGGVEMVRKALVAYAYDPEATTSLVAEVREAFYSGRAGLGQT